MSNGNSYVWLITGRVLKIDKITPFTDTNPDGISVRLFSVGNVNQLGNSSINDSNGNFSITLTKPQPGSAALNLIIKVYDGQDRLLYQSDIFTPSLSEDTYSLGDVSVIDMPIAHTWIVRGLAFDQNTSTPFTQGNIRAFDGHTGVERYAESGFWYNHGQPGSFGLVIDRSRFQDSDVNKVAPYIIIRIFNYQEQLLWEYGPFTVPHSDYYINPSVNPSVTFPPGNSTVPDIPVVEDNWSVHGTLFDENGLPVTKSFTVKAFDVLHNNERPLEEVQSSSNGTYTIDYTKGKFQNGDTGRIAPNVRIKIFSEGVLIATSGTFYQAANPQEINIYNIPDTIIIPNDWSVSGAVLENGQISLTPLTVKAFDWFDDQAKPLGVAVQTDANGVYTIDYTKSAFQTIDPNRTAPNLFVEIFSDDVLVATSGFFNPANINQIINVNYDAVPQNWKVKGTIHNSQDDLVTNGIVSVYDVYPAGSEPYKLGEAEVGNTGQYCFNFSKEDFQRGNAFRTAPNLKVELHYPEGILLTESKVFDNAAQVQVINLKVNTGEPEDFEYCVYGTVTNRGGLPVAGHQVSAYALCVSESSKKFTEIFLKCGPEDNGAITDIQGDYVIKYDPELLKNPIIEDPIDHGPYTVSLFIRLPGPFDPKTGKMTYDTSPVVCHSAKRQRIDIQVNRHSGSDISEYCVVEAALEDYLTAMTDKSIANWEPDFSNRIKYLSCKTSIEEEKVLCYYYSLHFADWLDEALGSKTVRSNYDFEKFMYATFRAGYSCDVRTLCAADTTEYYAALINAIDNMIIPESVTANLPEFWAHWLVIVRLFASKVEAVGVSASVGAFAATILEVEKVPNPCLGSCTDVNIGIGENCPRPCPKEDAWKQQEEDNKKIVPKVVEIYQEVQGDMPSFWEEMWNNAGKEEKADRVFTDMFVTQLAFIYDVYAIANGFMPFAQGVYKYFAKTKISEYESPEEAFEIQNLAPIEEEEWLLMTEKFLDFTEGEYPKYLVGTTDEERLQVLAVTTRDMFDAKFPLENVAEAYTDSGDEKLLSIGNFLKSEDSEGFDLDTANIDTFDFKEHNIDIDMLKALQRINRLTEDPDAQLHLIEKELTTSYKISIIDEEIFVADHAEELGGIDEARQIHRLATMYATETLSMLGQFHNSLNFEGHGAMPAVNRGVEDESSGFMSVSPSSAAMGPASIQNFSTSSMFSISPSSAATNAAAAAAEPSPTYENLFGALTQIQFENTQSIFGASAYFVELLEFIDSLNRKNIFSRRPELTEIELTDANAETILPYIDIVLEMLENAVAPRQFFVEDSDAKIRDFLTAYSSTNPPTQLPPVPLNLINKLLEHAVEIPNIFEVISRPGGHYLLTGAWRVCFNNRRSITVPGITPAMTGYLITTFPQTTKSVSDLAVAPEHRNPQVYKALSELYFPLQLPLNPGADEVQETMRLMGVSKSDTILAFRRDSGNRYNDIEDNSEFETEFICANLGIHQGMKDLLEWKAGNKFVGREWELWGLQSSGNTIPAGSQGITGTWNSVMSYVPEFMHRTGMNVEEMLDLFALRIFNNVALHAFDAKGLETGDPKFYRINNLSIDNLSQIYRLIRIRSILQCSWKNLNSFLCSAYRDNGRMPNELNKIHVSRLFMARYSSIALADIGCFWGPVVSGVNKRFGSSPYEERFISKRLDDNAISQMRVLTGTDETPGSNSFGIINDNVKQTLQQVLRLSIADIDTIINKEIKFVDGIDNHFNLNNISRILRVALLAETLKISIDDFYALKELTGINPFNGNKPEDLLYFDDQCKRLQSRRLVPTAVKKFLTEPLSEENDEDDNEDNNKNEEKDRDVEWVQGSIKSLREIVKETENFLASDAVPIFDGDTAEERAEQFAEFKQNYREENTVERVKIDVAKSFSEFTGGDFDLAVQMLNKKEPRKKSMYELWNRLANVGWSRILTSGTTNKKSTVDDFSIPKEFLISETETKWSAVFIAPKDKIKFKVYFDACTVELKINGDIVVDNTNIPEQQFTVGEAVKIEITASAFIASREYYLNLEWDAAEEKDLRGNVERAFVKIPLWSLIPKASWSNYDKLTPALPVFRKTAEYLELTGMTPQFFRTLTDKALDNNKWEILLPEELPVELDTASECIDSGIWEKFTRLLDIQNLYAGFPIDKNLLVIEEGADLFWTMIETLESQDDLQEALKCLAGVQSRWNRTRLIDTVNTSIEKYNFESDDSSAEQVANPEMLAFILGSMPVIEKIGVPVNFLCNVQEPRPADVNVIKFRGALQQRLGMSSWNKMVTSMMDAMRIRRRDAIVAFLTRVGPLLNQNQQASSPTYFNYLKQVLYNAGVLISSDNTLVPSDGALPDNVKIYESLFLYAELTGVPALKTTNITPDHWAILDGRKGYRNDTDLYSYFLIDVKMNTEMITSRIVQASAAIQLFVQRVLLGLEPKAHLDESSIQKWGLLKNYRMWEACRKVFLYPENWIEPELRDDKTPFFEEFEAEFEGAEITSEIARKALGNFLKKFRAVAGLDIVGFYRGVSEIPRGMDTLHIIGKTKALPHQYYYRRCHRKNNLASVWTPWETISIDLEGNSILPVMFNGHLHLFWAQFKPANKPNPPEIINFLDGTEEGGELVCPKNTAVVELSFCWSSLIEGEWTEKNETRSFIDTKNEFYTNQDPKANVADRYHFKIGYIDNEKIEIQVYTSYKDDKTIVIAGIFTIYHDGESSFHEVSNVQGRQFNSDPQDTALIEDRTVSFEARALTRSDGTRLLGRTSTGFKYLAANSDFLATRFNDEPSFLIESSRTWLLQRSDNGKGAPRYKMEAVSHPIIKEFQKRLDEGGLGNLMRRETQALSMATGGYYGYGYSYYKYNYYYTVLLGYYTAGDWQAWSAGQNAFELRYLPKTALSRPYPMDVVDFNYGTPNGIYNWELFFYAPFHVAKQLSANQRYAEALEWFHLIFDPRNKATAYEKTKRWAQNLPRGARFWNFLPFFANSDANKTIEELMGLPNSRGAMPDKVALETLIDDWKNDPFNPHLIARKRIVAYQKSVIMSYIDTLVAWADQLFRIDTLESVNEAIQLYVLAAEVLGQRPQTIPSTLSVKTLSYTQMKARNMDAFSNVVMQLENSLVKRVEDAKTTGQGAINQATKQALNLAPKMYFFTVPRNERMMAYWDLLDDRLYKIRNGMNIEGVKRQLSLFAPPIDPAMLVRAAAAGIDIGAAMSDMFTPIPKYRFNFMVQKAIELCNIVQSMGGAVLSALEKKDAEEIARLRAEHESTLLQLSKEIREMQIEEAEATIEGLKKTIKNTEFRRDHYRDIINLCVDKNLGMSKKEISQLDNMREAAKYAKTAQGIRAGIKAVAALPDFIAGVSGFGGSPHIATTISALQKMSAFIGVAADVIEIKASESQNKASRVGIEAGYERRLKDWNFQADQADNELNVIKDQITGAEIRLEIAEKELENLEKQIAMSEDVYTFLKDKYTNKELYNWMLSQVSTLYSRSYQLAYDIAKRAEKSYEFELAISSSFIQFGHWDGLRRGLFAGERLMLDLRRMEMSYIEKNSRELEITKPISIAELNPQAIQELQETGECVFSLPEGLFDLDFPGHYFRRIRSVRLTIPCVAGPYTSVSAKLTLTKNRLRKSSLANPNDGSAYGYTGINDPRFIHQRIGIEGIATSQPDNATGMFDFNFRDDRYLPFEGAGAISEWRLELPTKLRQFDYRTIKDVVLHVSYTAREDGSLKASAQKWLDECTEQLIEDLSVDKDADPPSLNRLISLKHEFKDAYNSLLKNGKAEFEVTRGHYPYFLNFLNNKRLIIADGSEVLVATKQPESLLGSSLKVSFDDDENPIVSDSLAAGEYDKICSIPIGWNEEDERSAYFKCTIEVDDPKFNDSEVDDIILSLNYTVADEPNN